MRVVAFILLLVGSSAAFAASCHLAPDAQDRAFYDKAAVSAAVGHTWTGQAANQFAASVVYERRIAFYGLEYAESSPPFDHEERDLWDALVLSAVERGTYNTTGKTGPWLGFLTAAEWTHYIAWDAMFYRMRLQCP
jgi:hypothetical protein